MATLGELTTRIARKLQDTTNTAVSKVAIREAVNASVRHWKTRPWWFTEFEESVALTPGERALLLTTDALYLLEPGGVHVTDGGLLYAVEKITSAKFDLYDTQVTGRPWVYCYRAGGYELHPIPDSAYTAVVRGVKDYAAFATDSTDDTATNDLLTHAEDIIEQWTLSRIHATERQDLDMANTFAQLAERDYQNLLRTNNARNAPGHNAVHSFLV
jgi:hypothetical protein